MTSQYETRTPFAAQTIKADKRNAGRTDARQTPLELRTPNGELNADLRAWVYERLSRHLGKYATTIERIMVRFEEENGDRGGVGHKCSIHVALSALPAIVVDGVGENDREAFDLAAGRAERATRHSVEKHGFTNKSARQKQRENGVHVMDDVEIAPSEPQEDPGGWIVDDSTNGDGAYDAHVHTHNKVDANLTLRTRSASQSPKAQADRAAARRMR